MIMMQPNGNISSTRTDSSSLVHSDGSQPPAYTEGVESQTSLNQQASHFYQPLSVMPDWQRKKLIERIIEKHNVQVNFEGHKILSEKPSFSTEYPELASWIKDTFSALHVDAMYVIAFGLGCFKEFDDLREAKLGSQANTRVIEDWFQLNGTASGLEMMHDLSVVIKDAGCVLECGQGVWKFYGEMESLRSRPPRWEVLPGTQPMNAWVQTCYVAASTVFPKLAYSSFVKPMTMRFQFTSKEHDILNSRYDDDLRKLMAACDQHIRRFIQYNDDGKSLMDNLRKCFCRGVGHFATENFANTLSKFGAEFGAGKLT